MEVIACVQDGREAVRWSMETRPDVVLMDNAMAELNGTGATHIICERARMMDKLGIHDLAGLIKSAIQQGPASFE